MSKLGPTAKNQKVFLSYSWEDRPFAEKLSKILTANGAKVIDPANDVPAGSNIQDIILKAVRDSSSMIFVVPQQEGAGKGALAELGAARALGKRILAVSPNSSRLHNSGFARIITESAVVDASRISDLELADALQMAS
jgi:hypothetical protein